ncbi:hypothetical protein ACTFIU_001768 [Dictyostelium citrinum]
MEFITLITLDNEEIEVSSTTKQLITSINIQNNNNDKYNINIDSQYIDFLLDYVEWVEEHLEDYEKIQYTFKEKVEEDYLNQMLEITKDLGVLGLKDQLINYLNLLSLRKKNYYSLEQVLQHQKSDDFWMILDNCIYDVTKWIDKHPGGDTILSGLDKDCAFYFEIYHRTDESFRKLNKFFIGYLNQEDLKNVPKRYYDKQCLEKNDNEIPSNEFWNRLNKLCPQQQKQNNN